MSKLSLYFLYPGDLDSPTGGYRYDRRLIAELQERGVTVRTHSLPHCAPRPERRDLAEAQRILTSLPDGALVIIDGLAFAVLDELAQAEAQRLRLVALCHHPLALETGLAPALRESLTTSERRALSCARLVLVTSASTAEILTSDFSVAKEKILVAPPGTDRSDFAPCRGNPPTLLCIASLTPRKGHDVLVEALAEVADLSWQARLVGSAAFDPDWAQMLHDRVASLGLEERIVFAGEVRDTDDEYQQADLFVLPSRFEGYGMVFAEALAAGLPIVAGRSGAVPEVVPATAGILLEPDDAKALSAALRKLLEDESLRQSLQRGARAAAMHLPGWAETAALVADALRGIEAE